MDEKSKKMRGDKGRPGQPSAREGAERGAKRPIPSSNEDTGGSERIAKRLARAGISSRREAEALIAAGRVRVNGAVLSSPAFNVVPQDRIEVDGTLIPAIERTRLFLFHKPTGVVTTNRDPQGRRTVFDCLPAALPRLMTVGRLDINTEGLLLLTNDGGLARVLELPTTGWLRRYRARVHGKVEAEALASLSEGIAVGGVFYGAVEAALDREQGSNAWLTIGLREGKNREVKNILGALGLDVTRLIRVSYGPFQLGELGEGEVLELKGRLLRDQLGERLIAEAGSDFDAQVAKPFPNWPVRAGDEPRARPKRSPAPRVEEGGLIRNRKRVREQQREDALDRLQTARPQRFEKKRPDDKERSPDKGRSQDKDRSEDKKRDTPTRARASNVWMAPGARPVGKKKAEETSKPPHSGDRPNRRPAPGGKPDERRDRLRQPRAEGRATGPGDKPERYRPGGKPSAGRPGGKPSAGRPGGKPSAGRPGGRPQGSRPGGNSRLGGGKPGAGGFAKDSAKGPTKGPGSGSGGRPAPRGGPRRPPKKS